ncbi:Transcriptional regulator, Crp/Fnr family [hydrothermal vent metagenome]|uniref:Transcriptional regulator, Crp/Fnr family n=1 Tax=hydrothermal vent metagenome TaxID=652676 RepID=A0A3B0TKU6_9ZZZZ
MAIGLRVGDMDLIRSTTVFSGLSPETLELLISDASVQLHDRSEVLFMQGDPAIAFYVVFEGWVKIYRMTPAGEEAIVGVFTRGQSFAEAAAFIGDVYPASGETVTECRALIIPARRLFDRIQRSPEIGLAMLASTSHHLHQLIQQIEQLKAHTGAQRIAEFLLSLAPVDEGSCTIALPYDKTLIAGRLGMKPESLSRAFLRLRGVGVGIKQNMASITNVKILDDFVNKERAEVMRPQGAEHH